MSSEIHDPYARIPRLSDSQDTATVMTNAIAYGGTVNSCASRPSYPSPATMVGAKSEMLENGTEMEM